MVKLRQDGTGNYAAAQALYRTWIVQRGRGRRSCFRCGSSRPPPNQRVGPRIRPVDGLQPLPRGYALHFQALTGTGLPLNANDYRVEWRVTNTDEAAYRAGYLRREFYKPKSDNTKWERLKYRGVHLVDVFGKDESAMSGSSAKASRFGSSSVNFRRN